MTPDSSDRARRKKDVEVYHRYVRKKDVERASLHPYYVCKVSLSMGDTCCTLILVLRTWIGQAVQRIILPLQ